MAAIRAETANLFGAQISEKPTAPLSRIRVVAPEIDAMAKKLATEKPEPILGYIAGRKGQGALPGSNDIVYSTLPSGEAWPNLKLLRMVG
jgi:hypothetical protein